MAAATPSSATCAAPPGISAVDEYCEVIPSAGGPGGAERDPVSSRISQRTRKELARAGESGRAVLALPAGSPERATVNNRRGSRIPESGTRGAVASARRAHAPSQPSNDPFGALMNAVDRGIEAGPAYPWIIVSLTIGISGAAWVRRRRADAA